MLRTWGELSLDEFFEIARVRTEVFFLEQRIDEEELDERDREETTEHVWISDDRGVAAYLRVVVDEQPQEGNRDARRLIGRHGHEPLALHSQSYIQPLYAALGFEPYGDEYVEAGIPHVSMYRAATA